MGDVANKLRQRLFPRPFRIDGGDVEPALLLSHLVAIEHLLAASQPAAAEPDDRPRSDPTSDGLDRNFVVDLCNQLHRVHRTAKRLEEQGSREAERLNGHVERLQRLLETHQVSSLDLTGQQYDPGRMDFEPLGDPQPTKGLRWLTIIQCERPAVLLRGTLLQRAKGIVGSPVAS
jgi:hypothetical protein